MALQSSAAHGLPFSCFWICRHSVGLRRGIGQSKDLYLHRPTQTQKGLCTWNCICYKGRLHTFTFILISLWSIHFCDTVCRWHFRLPVRLDMFVGCVCVCVCVRARVCFVYMRERALVHGVQLWLATPPTRPSLTNCYGICARNWASGRVNTFRIREAVTFLPWLPDVSASITGRDIAYSELWASLAYPGKHYPN